MRWREGSRAAPRGHHAPRGGMSCIAQRTLRRDHPRRARATHRVVAGSGLVTRWRRHFARARAHTAPLTPDPEGSLWAPACAHVGAAQTRAREECVGRRECGRARQKALWHSRLSRACLLRTPRYPSASPHPIELTIDTFAPPWRPVLYHRLSRGAREPRHLSPACVARSRHHAPWPRRGAPRTRPLDGRC